MVVPLRSYNNGSAKDIAGAGNSMEEKTLDWATSQNKDGFTALLERIK